MKNKNQKEKLKFYLKEESKFFRFSRLSYRRIYENDRALL